MIARTFTAGRPSAAEPKPRLTMAEFAEARSLRSQKEESVYIDSYGCGARNIEQAGAQLGMVKAGGRRNGKGPGGNEVSEVQFFYIAMPCEHLIDSANQCRYKCAAWRDAGAALEGE